MSRYGFIVSAVKNRLSGGQAAIATDSLPVEIVG